MKKYLLFILGVLLFAIPASAETLSSYFNFRLPSISQRVPMAKACSIDGYKATAQQNTVLLSCLKQQDTYVVLPQVVPTKVKEGFFGASYNPVTGYQSRTTQYISAAATTIPVASTKDKANNQIVLSDISSSGTVKVYMNLEPGTSKEEPIVCTGVTATTWTGCTRGLAFQGGGETSSSTIATPHNAGASIIITNIGQFYNQFVSIDGEQDINGVKSFKSSPTVPTPTVGSQAVNKSYADGLVFAGSPTSTFTSLGQTQLGTQTQLASSTASSTAGAPLVVSTKWTTSTCQVAGLFVPVTDFDGKVSNVCLDLTENYGWSGSHTFAGTAIHSASTTLNSTTTLSSTTTVSGTMSDHTGSRIAGNYISSSQHTFTESWSSPALGVNSATTTIPANSLNTRGWVKITAFFTSLSVANADNMFFRLLYGGKTVTTTINNGSGANMTGGKGKIEAWIMANGAVNSQTIQMMTSVTTSSIATAPMLNGFDSTTASADSTVTQNVVLEAGNLTSGTGSVTVGPFMFEKVIN